ncbi:zinc metalloproteinase nas-39-like [Amphiura filiformis]|uniref:zinc metalloproteinase nas-39-like n=1 Tax=Amphiura filiformis TaxID=82378 RepID=UPI003B211230
MNSNCTPTCDDRCYDTADETTYPCQCDESCVSRHDCCQDYYLLCRPYLPCDYTTPWPGVGSYYSPYYPDDYLNNHNCRTLLISWNDTFQTIITFDDFNLQESDNCSADSLSIYDGDDEMSPLIGEYCGTDIPRFVTSTGPNATLIFDTDSSETSAGYSLRAVFGTACDSIVTSPGTVSSSNYPSKYYNNERCSTRIRAKPGKQVHLTFTDFDLEDRSSEGSCHDKLEVYDSGVANPDALIGEFCGSELPAVRSSGRNLLLVFSSDFLMNGKGYKADVTFVTAVKADLVGGRSPNEGRIEITHPKYGRGTVCEDFVVKTHF